MVLEPLLIGLRNFSNKTIVHDWVDAEHKVWQYFNRKFSVWNVERGQPLNSVFCLLTWNGSQNDSNIVIWGEVVVRILTKPVRANDGSESISTTFCVNQQPVTISNYG